MRVVVVCAGCCCCAKIAVMGRGWMVYGYVEGVGKGECRVQHTNGDDGGFGLPQSIEYGMRMRMMMVELSLVES